MDKRDNAATPLRQNAVAAQYLDKGSAVRAKVPQGYESKINVRFVPGRFRLPAFVTGCQPRQGAPRRDVDLIPLPKTLVDKLQEVNVRVVEWLSREPANASLFLAQPVEALLKAGVELTRAEQKALLRTFNAANEERIIPPGVKLADLSATAAPKGRVSDRAGRPKPQPHDGNCGCGGKE